MPLSEAVTILPLSHVLQALYPQRNDMIFVTPELMIGHTAYGYGMYIPRIASGTYYYSYIIILLECFSAAIFSCTDTRYRRTTIIGLPIDSKLLVFCSLV